MGYLQGFLITLRQIKKLGGTHVTTEYSGGYEGGRHDEKIAKPERLHGRHVLNKYEDGMEKCIGCELCAGVCPAKCIYVRGADNDPDEDVARTHWLVSSSSPPSHNSHGMRLARPSSSTSNSSLV